MTTAAPDGRGDGAGLYRDLAALGGFFSVLAPPPVDSDAVPWTKVLAEEALVPRFAAVRESLAAGDGLAAEDVDPKVAVSATQVGLASRLWSVALAAAVLHGWVPDLGSDSLVASPVLRGGVPLGLVRPGQGYAVASLPEAAATISRTVVDDSLTALHRACSTVGRTPEQVLVSNSTSALVGAARVLTVSRPDSASEAWELTRLLLALPAVAAGGAILDRTGLDERVGGAVDRADEAFLRSGCCVFYRLPEHGLCPDCVLAPSRPDQVTPGH